MYIAGVIQVHVGHHTARHQNCSRSFDEMDTTRLLYSQRHHHLHHLKPQHRQPINKIHSMPQEYSFTKNLPHSPQSLHMSLLHKHVLHPQLCIAVVYQQRAT